MLRPKLNIEEQIQKLKSKGIKFISFSEEDAIDILSNRTYFTKLKIYAKNFQHEIKNNKNYYENIDFIHLYAMSKLDMIFREFLIRFTLDIEHMYKTKLLNDFCISPEDGYSIVKDFLEKNTYIEDRITQLSKTDTKKYDYKHSPSVRLAKKYISEPAIWRFIELLQFREFIKFFIFFYERHKSLLDFKINHLKDIENLLFCTRMIRNSSAHNSCILVDLRNYRKIKIKKKIKLKNDLHVKRNLKNILNIQVDESMKQVLSILPISDIIASLLIFCSIDKSKNTKKRNFRRFINLLRNIKNEKIYHCLLTDSNLKNIYKNICKIAIECYKKIY